jgi:hypothetical protein
MVIVILAPLRLKEFFGFILIVFEHLSGCVDLFEDERAETFVLEGFSDVAL